jgi:GNAT superfamily N-acetyltransferase
LPILKDRTTEAAPGPLYLASSDCPGLAEWLAMHRRSGPVVVITAASAGLPDQAGIVEPLVAAAMATGAGTLVLDLQADPRPALETAGAVVLPGGDPFRLLRELRASGAAAVIARRGAAGLPVAGQSAGAMVCAPTLVPVTLTSPFTPAPGQDLEGLRLTPTLVLPHHDRPGRADRHRAAALRHGGAGLVPLWDGEVRLESAAGWEIRAGDRVTRPARVGDASAVAAVFRAATIAAWGAFLGAARLRAAPDDTPLWTGRIEAGGEGFLVTEDAHGLPGFVCWRPSSDDAPESQRTGEVDLLYTLPRAWGLGIGRRLLERATFALLAAGYREAVLWTEARNERALAVYRRNGWVRDGAFIDREYLGVPIRNLRHRLDLTRFAGSRKGSD